MTVTAALSLLAHDSDGWGHHWWPIWPLLWVALIAAIIWFVAKRRGRPGDPLHRAREVLAERYARGELSGEEYRQRLDELHRATREASTTW